MALHLGYGIASGTVPKGRWSVVVRLGGKGHIVASCRPWSVALDAMTSAARENVLGKGMAYIRDESLKCLAASAAVITREGLGTVVVTSFEPGYETDSVPDANDGE